MSLWSTIAVRIEEVTGTPFTPTSQSAVGGGCINAAHRITDGDRTFFVKLNDEHQLSMFETEAEGLMEIAATGTVRVPEPVGWGSTDGHAFLVLEYLELGGGGALERLGRNLAAMHRVTHPRFGWHRDNVIGATHQPNGEEAEWVRFFAERRIGFQLDLALRKGAGSRMAKKGEALIERLPALFTDYRPVPSLLHGDLWGGNHAVTREGEPVIFDPAVYYGDREADIAMTELFGGFGGAFRAAYEEAWPLDPGYATRRTLYNLYHILNHFNLFGGGYGAQAEGMMDRLLAELR